ncbi:MAG: tetratricopeptide repeat protein [Pyrinomonadaceae bacterium]
MKKLVVLFVLGLAGFASGVFGQAVDRAADKSVEDKITWEARAKSYAKLLEGQRYLIAIRRSDSELTKSVSENLARDAFTEATRLNPQLAEGYTALGELILYSPKPNLDEVVALFEKAVSIDRNNFGAQKYLGRLFVVRSELYGGPLAKVFTDKAIGAWTEVGRIDPRNAEAWAFLSVLYRFKNNKDARIDAMRKWLASANSDDSEFFARYSKTSRGLSPENAAVPLGEALLDNNQRQEALSVLSRAVADNPEDLQGIDLLGRALEGADEKELPPQIEALRQAVYAYPENLSLIQMLAETLARTGDVDSAAKVIKSGSEKLSGKQAAGLMMALGDIYSDHDRFDSAMFSYRDALRLRGITAGKAVGDEDRGFALLVISRMLQLLQLSNRVPDADKLIDDSRGLFSNDDFVLDKERISLMRSTGRRTEALNLVKALRIKAPGDYSLLRREAEILTDLGRVEEGVALISDLIDNKPADSPRSMKYDDFVNRLFIAGLFVEAGRSDDALANAEKAFALANGEQSKQLAKLKIISAQIVGGNLGDAEQNLKDLLKQTPNNPMALNDLGYVYLQKGTNFEEAARFIERAVDIDPRNPEYLENLGLAYFKLGDLEKAEKTLRKAIRIDVGSAEAHETLGDVLAKKGQKSEARVYWSKAKNFVTSKLAVQRLSKKLQE